MPDKQTQFDSMNANSFVRLFDDIFSTHEETIVPLAKVKKHRGRIHQKEKRTMLVEKIKKEKMKSAMDTLNSDRANTEDHVELKMAEKVFEEVLVPGTDHFEEITLLMKTQNISKRTAAAHYPMDVQIPNYNLRRTMHEWGMGGPTSRQYKLVSHLINFPRKAAMSFYLGMICAYVAFRENWKTFPRTDIEDDVTKLNKFFFNKAEEDVVIDLFLPKDIEKPTPDEEHYMDGPSIGKVFLKLDFLTKRNDVFKAFVKKTMQLDSSIRERLATKYFFNRMFELNNKFINTQEMKYNYIRIAWERKFHFMDDYIICLVLFIKDKSTNITWDEVEDIIYSEARDVLQESFKIAWNAANIGLAKPFDVPEGSSNCIDLL
ncbi:unnamed protein product [Caenorhabditis brenneri]